jgi:hypothetical protein
MLFAPWSDIQRLILTGSVLLLCFASTVFAAQNKVDICHVKGQGKFKLLTIAEPAYAAHIAHGDKDVEHFFQDADGDGFGSPVEVITACDVPEGYVEDDTDCDDTNADVYPGAPEMEGNDIIEDCNFQPRLDACPCRGQQVGEARWAEGGWTGGQCQMIQGGFRIAAGVSTGEGVRAALAAFAADSATNEYPAKCSIHYEPTSQLLEREITEEQRMACVQSLRDIARRSGLICPQT